MATRHLPLYEFFWHLSEAQRAGVPLLQILRDIARHAPRASLRKAYADIVLSLKNGQRLGQALRAHPRLFDETVCALVDAGEESGKLAASFARCAEIVKLRDTRKRDMDRATREPKFTAIVILGLALFAGKDTLASFGLLLLFFMAVLAVSWRVSPIFRSLVLNALLYVPPLGGIIRRNGWARFAESLGFLYASGIGLREAANAAAEAQPVGALKAAFRRIADRLAHKSSLEAAFVAEGGTDRLVLSMIRAGERSGNLSASLHEAVTRLDEENDRQITALRQFLAPALVLVLGAVVYSNF